MPSPNFGRRLSAGVEQGRQWRNDKKEEDPIIPALILKEDFLSPPSLLSPQRVRSTRSCRPLGLPSALTVGEFPDLRAKPPPEGGRPHHRRRRRTGGRGTLNATIPARNCSSTITITTTQTSPHNHTPAFGSGANITLTATTTSRGAGPLVPTKMYDVVWLLCIASSSQTVSVDVYNDVRSLTSFPSSCLASSERSMVQFQRSSRNHHVCHGVGAAALLSVYRDGVNDHGGHPRLPGDDLQRLGSPGIGQSCQNQSVRPWVGAGLGHPVRTATPPQGLAQHVRSMSNLQTSRKSPLPDLQPVHFSDGPSLPVDEQLCGQSQPQTLFIVLGLYVDVCRLFSHPLWVELLFLCRRGLYLPSRGSPPRSHHDALGRRGLSLVRTHTTNPPVPGPDRLGLWSSKKRTTELFACLVACRVLPICLSHSTSSMLMNVLYGVLTGIGTIDRLKKKATNTMSQSDEEPIALIDVFGIAPIWTWPFPTDPIFDDYDRVMGYSMPQRLDRERQFCDLQRPIPDLKDTTSMEIPKCVNDLLPV